MRTIIKITAFLVLTASYISANASQQQDFLTNDVPATTMPLGSINVDIYDKTTKTLNSAIMGVRISNETQNILVNIISMTTDRGASYMFLDVDPNAVKLLKASISMYQSAISKQLKQAPDVPNPMQQTLASFNVKGYWETQGVWQSTGARKDIKTTLLLRYVNAQTYAFIMSIEEETLDNSPILIYINDSQLMALQTLLSPEAAKDAQQKAQKSIDVLYPSQY